MWNSNLVSTLQSTESNSSTAGSPSTSIELDQTKKPRQQNSANAGANKRSSGSNKSKSKLSRVRYFLHPGEPAVGQIVSDSLTDGQDNNNTLSLKQPQVNVFENS